MPNPSRPSDPPPAVADPLGDARAKVAEDPVFAVAVAGAALDMLAAGIPAQTDPQAVAVAAFVALVLPAAAG